MKHLGLLLPVLLFVIGGPVLGGLLAGIDRRITARMQRRYGPPILQPFYDVAKLFHKEDIIVRLSQNNYIIFYLLFVIFTGILFFTGQDFLLVIFSLTLAGIFFVLAGYKGSSPFSHIGAERELIQILAYEPMLFITAIGMYQVVHSFNLHSIMHFHKPLIVLLPGIFIGLFEALTIKLRKSPFDLSTSHHGHQEIVKGITTEFSGSTLALIEITHWYELIIFGGLVYLFFASSPLLGILVCLAVWFLEILIDNIFARFRWQLALYTTWITTLIFGFGNILLLSCR